MKTSKNKIIEYITENFINNKDFIAEGDKCYILYKNGEEYYLSASEENGKFKKSGIVVAIVDCCEFTLVYSVNKIDYCKLLNYDSDD